jgi:hypothetical protein
MFCDSSLRDKVQNRFGGLGVNNKSVGSMSAVRMSWAWKTKATPLFRAASSIQSICGYRKKIVADELLRPGVDQRRGRYPRAGAEFRDVVHHPADTQQDGQVLADVGGLGQHRFLQVVNQHERPQAF